MANSFGTLSNGLHTHCTARSTHAVLGYWREHARCISQSLASFLHIQSCNFVSHIQTGLGCSFGENVPDRCFRMSRLRPQNANHRLHPTLRRFIDI
jgi:hypothetical protein